MAPGTQERFGEQLRRHREAAGYSQEDLAERAGISANAIGALERGERKRPYPDTIRRLADALGLDDATRLALANALRGGGDASPGQDARAPLARPGPELPGEPTPFIGREREAGVVRHLLAHAEGRLLTLIGPGGVGKTRLALHVAWAMAEEFADGVVWVELAPLGDPALVLPTIARAIGLDELPGGDHVVALRGWLRERHVLLVLDNLEHLLDAVPALAQLLLACPNLRMLATSRSPLKIRGEQEYLVPPLELPPAGPVRDARDLAYASSVQFFTWQAQQKDPSFALTPENVPVVAAICRRLDGLPLAMELVAARVRVLSPAELLARLDHQMPLLTGGARDLPQRQQTMRAAMAWSYDLLAPEGQALFRRLAVFAGGWTLEAAGAVGVADAGGDDEVLDRLDGLVEQSLVTVTHDADETRYGMLEPVRQYALERLEASGEAGATWRRHAEYYQELAGRAAAGLEGRSGQETWLRRLDREHDNVRVALAWCERAGDAAEIGLRLASSLWRYWEMRWHVDEGSRWLASALTRSEGLPPTLRAYALSGAGNLARDRADHDQATIYHQQSLAIRRQLGDARGVAISLNNLGVIARDRGDAARTQELCLESLDLFRAACDQHGAAIALISLGTAAGQSGQYAQGRAWYEESLAIFRAEGDGWHTAWVLTYLAELLVQHGDGEAAAAAAGEGLALHRVAGDAWGLGMALSVLGKVAQVEGDPDTAAARFAEALRLMLGARVERAIPAGLANVASLLLASGQPERAARLAGASEALRQQGGDVHAPGREPVDAAAVAELRNGPHAAAWRAGRALTREQVLAEAWAVAGEDLLRGAPDRTAASAPPVS